jgi:SAM-dependent methyltransferase
VIRFLDREDEFYEGAFENQIHFLPRSERLWNAWPLWLINSGYPWLVRRHVPAGSTIVELGCAGGVKYFGQRYRMIGCDLSLSGLKAAGAFYECCVQADASRRIPVESTSVDAVVSSYFWEHIPRDVKPRILAECLRILRPGGHLIFLYDVATENPLIDRFRRRDPGLYEKLFIEADGHLGYESIAENRALFRRAGLVLVEEHGLEKTPLMGASVFSKLARFGPIPRAVLGWTSVLGRTPFFQAYTGLVRVTDAWLDPLLPERWARTCVTVCRAAARSSSRLT